MAATLQGFAPNVRCHLEDALLPGVTRAAIAEQLERRVGAAGDSLHGGRRLAGWYLQQVGCMMSIMSCCCMPRSSSTAVSLRPGTVKCPW